VPSPSKTDRVAKLESEAVPSGTTSGASTDVSPQAVAASSAGIDEQTASRGRVRVDVRGVHRPFMRGILVHSLTEQGFSFEDAYAVSQEVWMHVRERELVTKEELRKLVDDFSRTSPGGRFKTLNPILGHQLEVVGKDGRWPFSQGRLRQSLLATGIDPRLAFEVVTEIERDLRIRGERRVTRDSIRSLASGILERRFGESSARRYHHWRVFQNEEDRPLILLLGGASGVGKSSLALEVARRLAIARVMSTDSIRDVMRVMVSNDLVPTLHVSSFEAHSRLVSEVSEGLDPVVEGFLEQSRTVAVGVRAVIERAIAEGTNTALDGVSLVPGLLDLTEWQDRAHIVFLVAADEDRESLHGHLVARAEGSGARASERYMQNFKEIFRIQEELLGRAENCGVPVVDVQDLESAAQQVVSYVVDQLGERHAAQASRPS
jgi:2-phosphoglycerate kinase